MGGGDALPVVVMGVSGSGKTTIGQELATALGAVFLDADDLHSPTNRAKMSRGIPLTDDDRQPWLREVGAAIADARARHSRLIVACSALRRRYRDIIRSAVVGHVAFVHLTGGEELIHSRLTERRDHFMPAGLLRSQLDTLEPLRPDEIGISLYNVRPAPAIAAQITAWLTTEEEDHVSP